MTETGTQDQNSIASDEETIRELVNRFRGDIVFDCHSTPSSYRRSVSRKVLLNIGPKALPRIADGIREDFPNLETSKLPADKVYWRMFEAWVYLVTDFRERYSLVNGPYDPEVVYGDRDIQKYVEYCELPSHIDA